MCFDVNYVTPMMWIELIHHALKGTLRPGERLKASLKVSKPDVEWLLAQSMDCASSVVPSGVVPSMDCPDPWFAHNIMAR